MTFPSNYTPSWISYMESKNTADIVSSPEVATAIGTKVDATNGQATGMQLQASSIDGTTTINGVAASKISALASAEYINFTPSLLFGGANTGMTINYPVSAYLLVGEIVYFWMSCRLIYKGSATGNATISGLPMAAVGGFPFQCQVSSTGVSSNNSSVTASILADTIAIYRSQNQYNTDSPATDADFENAAVINISGWYPVEQQN